MKSIVTPIIVVNITYDYVVMTLEQQMVLSILPVFHEYEASSYKLSLIVLHSS